MEKVPDTHHLKTVRGVYYYRRRVPKHAIATFGKTFIQKSLGTRDRKQAIKLRELEDVKWSATFDAIEASPHVEVPQSGKKTPSTGPAPLAAVIAYVKRMDGAHGAKSLAEPPIDQDERRAIEQDIETGLQSLDDYDDPNGALWIDGVGKRIRAESKQGGGDLPESAEFEELVRRALIEISRRKLGRLRLQNDKAFYDPLFDPDRPTETTFGAVASQYVAEKVEKAAINKESDKWVAKVEALVGVVTEIVGKSTLISAINYQACVEFRSTIAKLPTNKSKLYPKLSIEQAIEKAAAEMRPLMSTTTQRQYLDTFKAVLRLATLQGLLKSNPAETLQPLKKDEVSADKKRLPFSLEQIEQFFHSEFYKSCTPGAAHLNRPGFVGGPDS